MNQALSCAKKCHKIIFRLNSLSKKKLNSTELFRRYARALFNICDNAQQVSKYLKNLEDIINLKENNKTFSNFLSNPLITSQKKILIIDKISKLLFADKTFSDFLKVVAKHNKLYGLESIYKIFKSMIQNQSNEISLEVITASEIKKETEIKLKKKFEKITGKKVNINSYIDGSIIGGLIIKINSLMIDSSIKTKLEKYQFSMKGIG